MRWVSCCSAIRKGGTTAPVNPRASERACARESETTLQLRSSSKGSGCDDEARLHQFATMRGHLSDEGVACIPLASHGPALVIDHWPDPDRKPIVRFGRFGGDVYLDPEGNMKKILTASAAAALVLAMSVPAFAGGAHCSGGASASMVKSAAWAGAWFERTASGTVTIAEVANGSPAARAGLKPGDIVLAVNGYDLSDSEARATCASKAACKVGATVTYTVQRGESSKDVRLKLAKMPAYATQRFASRQADFDPALAAIVMPATY